MSNERITDLRAVKEVVEEMVDGQKVLHEDFNKRFDGLEGRVEDLESRRGAPGKAPDGKGHKNRAWRVYETGTGPVVELPASVKMVDALPPDKTPEISLERILAAMFLGEKCQDKSALEYWREIKQLTTTTSGMLIPAQYQSEWIDLIRAQMVLQAAGLTTVVMDAKTYNASALVSDPDASWHTEAGSINVGNPTFEARQLTASTLVVRCTGSVEVAQDSPNFGAQLASAMTRAMAVKLDGGGLVGSGIAPEVKGILGTSGIKQVPNVGGIADYSDMLTGVKELLDSGLSLETATRVAIMSPSSWLAYESLATGITSDKTQLARPRALQNTQFLVTANGLDQGSPATSTIFLGDFSDLVLGVRREASVEVLKLNSYGSNLVLEFIGYLRADYMVRRPASFCTLEDITVA